MIVYRIANQLYSHDLSGAGAKTFGGRWNSRGTSMLYTSQSVSLALLEMLVHSQFTDYSNALDLIYINLASDTNTKEIKLSNLKSNWIEDDGYTKFIGDEFIKSAQHLILKTPSAVVNEEYNYLINPLHPEFKKIKIQKTTSFHPDKRFFSIQ